MSKIKYRTIAIYDTDHAAIKKLAEDNARSIPRQLSYMIRNWKNSSEVPGSLGI
jgi:hypothetical protein